MYTTEVSMYLFGLLITAFVIIYTLMTNWPVKLYQNWRLQELAKLLKTEVTEHGIWFTNIASEIKTDYYEYPLTVRFVAGSVDALKSSSGMEVRLKATFPAVIQITSSLRGRTAYGQFQKVTMKVMEIEQRWLIISDNPSQALLLLESETWQNLLTSNFSFEQIMINPDELIIRLHYLSTTKLLELLEKLRVTLDNLKN